MKDFVSIQRISQMMVFINDAYKAEALPKEYVEGFVKMIAPVAPHIGGRTMEQTWITKKQLRMKLGQHLMKSKLVDDEVEIVVQINGKVRAKLTMSKDASKEEMEQLALEAIKEQIEGKTVRKVIVVPGKLVNVVAN